MQLDIPTFLSAGGVPDKVSEAAMGSRKLEIDLHISDLNGHLGQSIRIDNLCMVVQNGRAINWNRDEGLVDVEYED